jgi:hypothetical protein
MIGWDNIKPADPQIERALIELHDAPMVRWGTCRKCAHFYKNGGGHADRGGWVSTGECRSHKRWTVEDAFCQPGEPQKFEPRL